MITFKSDLEKIKIQKDTKKLLLTVIIGFLIVCVLSVAGWFVYRYLQFKTYEDKEYHFSIKYPSKWEMKERTLGTAIAFVQPKNTALDVFQPNANVTVQEVPDEIATLDRYSATITKQMTAVFGRNIKILEDKDITFGARRGHRLVIEAPEPQNLKAVFIWTVKGPKAYNLTFMSRIDQYKGISSQVEEMTNSFKFK